MHDHHPPRQEAEDYEAPSPLTGAAAIDMEDVERQWIATKILEDARRKEHTLAGGRLLLGCLLASAGPVPRVYLAIMGVAATLWHHEATLTEREILERLELVIPALAGRRYLRVTHRQVAVRAVRQMAAVRAGLASAAFGAAA